jgi:hypothetical protein
MANAELYGPNTKLINELSLRLQSYPWFTRIETAHPDDGRFVRVKLEYLLEKPVDPWNGAAADAQARTQRQIIESSRISEQHHLQWAFRTPWSVTPVITKRQIVTRMNCLNFRSGLFVVRFTSVWWMV